LQKATLRLSPDSRSLPHLTHPGSIRQWDNPTWVGRRLAEAGHQFQQDLGVQEKAMKIFKIPVARQVSEAVLHRYLTISLLTQITLYCRVSLGYPRA
jgi:hypothetical protein